MQHLSQAAPDPCGVRPDRQAALERPDGQFLLTGILHAVAGIKIEHEVARMQHDGSTQDIAHQRNVTRAKGHCRKPRQRARPRPTEIGRLRKSPDLRDIGSILSIHHLANGCGKWIRIGLIQRLGPCHQRGHRFDFDAKGHQMPAGGNPQFQPVHQVRCLTTVTNSLGYFRRRQLVQVNAIVDERLAQLLLHPHPARLVVVRSAQDDDLFDPFNHLAITIGDRELLQKGLRAVERSLIHHAFRQSIPQLLFRCTQLQPWLTLSDRRRTSDTQQFRRLRNSFIHPTGPHTLLRAPFLLHEKCSGRNCPHGQHHDRRQSQSQTPRLALMRHRRFRARHRQFRRPRPFGQSCLILLNLCGHHARIARTIPGLYGQTMPGDRNQFTIPGATAKPPQRRRQIPILRGLQYLVSISDIRSRTGQDFAQDRAERKHVRAFRNAIGLSARLFGTHVRRRTENRSRHGQRRRLPGSHRLNHADIRVGSALVRQPPARQYFGEPPIHHLHFAERADHYVRRLKITMHHTLGVRIGNRLTNLTEDGHEALQVIGRIISFRQQRGECATLDELHGKERSAGIGEPEFVNRKYARMLQLRGDLRFFNEPGDHPRPRCMLAPQHFDRHVPPQVRIAPLEHHTHAAARNLAGHLIASECVTFGLRASVSRKCNRHPVIRRIAKQYARLNAQGFLQGSHHTDSRVVPKHGFLGHPFRAPKCRGKSDIKFIVDGIKRAIIPEFRAGHGQHSRRSVVGLSVRPWTGSTVIRFSRAKNEQNKKSASRISVN